MNERVESAAQQCIGDVQWHASCASVLIVKYQIWVCNVQFFFDFAKLADGDIELVTVITNAACIRYQLLGEQPVSYFIDSMTIPPLSLSLCTLFPRALW